jgi:hypothetical protein
VERGSQKANAERASCQRNEANDREDPTAESAGGEADSDEDHPRERPDTPPETAVHEPYEAHGSSV